MTRDAIESEETAVQFATAKRAHIGLPTQDLEASVRYYSVLFGMPPTKLRDGYAKFEVAEPPLNLSLNRSALPEAPHATRHFGVQVKSRADVQAAHGKLKAAGFATFDETGTTCCFAVQDKVWSVDPDGNRWEVFVVLDDSAEVHSVPEPGAAKPSGQDQPTKKCCQ